MNSLFSLLLAAMCLVLLSGEESSQVATSAPDVEVIDAEKLEEFPGDWDEVANTEASTSNAVPEPTAAIMIGVIGFAVMLRRRA